MDELDRLRKELEEERDRCKFWEDTAVKAEQGTEYYQKQLEDAHTLLGMVIHQFGERWDSVNLTKYFPTDNPHGFRTINNPSGK